MTKAEEAIARQKLKAVGMTEDKIECALQMLEVLEEEKANKASIAYLDELTRQRGW